MKAKINNIIHYSDKNIPIYLIFLFFLTFLFRLLIAFKVGNTFFWYDEKNYQELAVRILTGKGYNSTLWAPLEPYFLALIYFFSGVHVAIARVIQTLLAGTIAVFIFYVAKSFFSTRCALLASCIFCVYPLWIFVPAMLYPTTIFTFLLIIALLFLTKYQFQERRPIYLAISGSLLGLSALAIPTIGFFLPFIFIWLLITVKQTFIQSVKHSMILYIFFIAIISIWTIHNYGEYHELILITTEGGHSFWEGNNPNADPFRKHICQESEKLKEKLKGLNYPQQSKVYMDEALAFIKNSPDKFIELTAEKFLNFWRIYPRTYSKNKFSISKLSKWANVMTAGPLLFFFVLGLFFSLRHWGKFILLYGLIFTFSIVYSFFTTTLRYRLPIEPIIMAFAAYGFITTYNLIAKWNYTS